LLSKKSIVQELVGSGWIILF